MKTMKNNLVKNKSVMSHSWDQD